MTSNRDRRDARASPVIVEAVSDEDLAAVFDVARQLREHLRREEFVAQVRRQERAGYRVISVQREGAVLAVAGFRISESLSAGRHVYVDDLVTDASARSEGYGGMLLDWIAECGRRHGCRSLHLDSGVQRHGAHRFYLRHRMDIVFYHFRKAL